MLHAAQRHDDLHEAHVCHTRVLAYPIMHGFDRFVKYSAKVKTGFVFATCPPRRTGRCGRTTAQTSTSGRLHGLALVWDECDECAT